MRLLARHRCPTDAHYNGPHWPEAEGIGDLALYGGIDAEELAELLGDFAEDLEGAAPDAQRDRDAARAIVQYLEEHAPTPRSSTEG